jgi:tetratricopeptide (TPR) repeat protein
LAAGDAANAKAKAANGLAQSQNPNDKANALRSLAESGLALNQFPQAANDAEQALQIDQTQGSSLRVIADLKLLALIHAKAGNADKSRAYTELGQAASLARSQLISK